MESGLTKAQILSAVQTLSPHGNLTLYTPVCGRAATEDVEFFAHLIAWNHQKGEIRDAKAALPMLALQGVTSWKEGRENALAHLADLSPKLLVKALDFGKTLSIPSRFKTLRGFVERYLRDLEADRRDFDAAAVQHRQSLRRLYTAYHINAAPFARTAVIEGHSVEGKFGIVKQLPSMSPLEIVNAVERYKLPWLIVRGALGARVKEPEILMALIGRMTAADLATSAKWMLKAGVKDHAETRAAFEGLLQKAVKPRRAKGTTLKAGKAAKVLEDLGEEKTAGKLRAVQAKQLEQLRTVEGNWLIIGDKSNSMQQTITLAKQVAAILAQSVKGHVYLVFADTSPRVVGDVSGKRHAAIEMTTAAVVAGGGTSLGCALEYAREQKWELDGIVVVSDGAENTYPTLGEQYLLYTQTHHQHPTVYWYRTQQDTDPRTPPWIAAFIHNMQVAQSGMTTFDLTGSLDSYSLPNLVQTMRIGKYDLLDEIMGTRLRTLDEVLTRTVGMGVKGGRTSAPAHVEG